MREDLLRTGLITSAVFLFMLALNHFMPIHRDDYDYAMVWKTGAHLASLSDVAASGVQHYLLHGGRTVTVFCLQLFLWLGKTAFDIANALMFLALVVLVTMHARRALTFWHAPGLFAAAALLLWLALPHFGEVAIWKSGSTVYLWSAVPAFLFLLPYNLTLKNPATGTSGRRTWAILPMFLLGILGGWSIENLAVTVVAVAFGASLYVWRRYGTLPVWMIAGVLGALLGLIGLVAAPGNYVRYDAQGADKDILAHIGNQFAGQVEMVLYCLPVLLLILTAWRLYRRIEARMDVPPAGRTGAGTAALAAVLALLVLSYFTGGWIAGTIRDVTIGGVLTPLGQTKPKTIHLFTNLMNGFEEMAIYWFAVLLFYARIKRQLGLTAAAVRSAAECVPMSAVLRRHPAARYAAFLMGLAVCNNLVMLAAPTFPGRATFSSSAMLVAAALALLGDSAIMTALGVSARRTLCAAALLLFAYTGTAALLITHEMGAADAARIAQIEEARARGEIIVHFPPIERTNRALRHVYYEDWDNNVTKEGAMEYFGLTDVVVEK
ncbi:hypothetical protein HMPREF9334_01046 [Selenomonas infelix ATCC 43532]|uniref:Glycosyltransferase RgtA/B/C/D-like domain-containing protein n=1 Tax=Selenomonas infelix ATCC 43532 TaxID=679201 RepID=G5GP65_9FIRM|nr:DUF6056 family protein [Selenomonas infelix]EHG21114.1 hypothetical protein HMPREF9334_01046 [Selenomonas infelix ATCC 43532]